MNIATLGVSINPAAAVAGAATATTAAQKMGSAWDRIVASFAKGQGVFSGIFGAVGGAFKKMVDGVLQNTGVFGRAMTTMASAAARMAGAVTASVGAVTGIFGKMLGGVGGAIRGISGFFAQFGLAVNGLKAMFGPVVGLLGSVIDSAADFEVFNQKWAFMLGSFDKAKAKMKELQDFANATPFDLPGVSTAALALFKLKDAALEGKKGLTLVGDAAAMAVSPDGIVQIEDMALKVARLYGNLKAGNGGGDELRMLRDWQVVSAEAGQAIGKMGQDASKFKEAWALVVSELQKSHGAMDVQSTSWKGLMSSLDDAWNTLKTAVGTPLLEGLKPLIGDLQNGLAGITAEALKFAPAIKELALAVSATFRVMQQEGGLKLAFTAAVDTLKDLLSRTWTWSAAALGVVFDWLGKKFTKAMAYIASEEFWSGVGRGLLKGAAMFVNFIADAIPGLGSADRKFDAGLEKAKADMIYKRTPTQVRTALENNPNAYNGAGSDALPDSPGKPPDDSLFPGLPAFPSAKLTESQNLFSAALDLATRGLKKETAVIDDKNDETVKAAAAAAAAAEGSGASLPGKAAKKTAEERAAESAERHMDTLAKKYIDEDPQAEYNRKIAEIDMLAAHEKLTTEQVAIAKRKASEELSLDIKKQREETERAAEAQMTALQKLAHQWGKLKENTEQATAAIASAIADNITTAITGLISGTETLASAFTKMAQGIVQSIIKIITQLYVQYYLSKLLGMAGGGAPGSAGAFFSTALSSVHHDGGVVTGGGTQRVVGASAFSSAARFHTGGVAGLRAGEVAAVLEKGEEVITARESASRRKKKLTGEGSAPSAPAQPVIANFIDPQMLANFMAANPGAFLNVLALNGKQAQNIIRNA